VVRFGIFEKKKHLLERKKGNAFEKVKFLSFYPRGESDNLSEQWQGNIKI
jgi:hypothetical protein